MMKLTAILLSLTLLVGCLPTNTPAQNTAAVLTEAQTQHAALTSALNQYCGVVAASDSEMIKLCTSVQTAVNPTTAAIQTAIGLIITLLARRKMFERAMLDTREAECHK